MDYNHSDWFESQNIKRDSFGVAYGCPAIFSIRFKKNNLHLFAPPMLYDLHHVLIDMKPDKTHQLIIVL